MALSTMGRREQHLLQQTSQSLHRCFRSSSTLPTEFVLKISRSLCSTRPTKQLFHPRLLDYQPVVQRTSPSRSIALLGKTHVRSMSSDADYAAFLDKANQDTGSAGVREASSSQKKGYGTKSVNTAVPSALKQVEEYYVSDSDEPFEPVALEFSGSSVSAEDLAKLLATEKVEEVKGTGFESQYKNVVDVVKKESNGTVKVFRVELEGARAEYYVVGVDEKEGRIVGLKALAVES